MWRVRGVERWAEPVSEEGEGRGELEMTWDEMMEMSARGTQSAYGTTCAFPAARAPSQGGLDLHRGEASPPYPA